MKKAYVVYFTEYDDLLEAAFDEDLNMIGCWSPNDACWRHEYFYGFLKKLGIDISDPPKGVNKQLQKKMYDYCKGRGYLDDY